MALNSVVSILVVLCILLFLVVGIFACVVVIRRRRLREVRNELLRRWEGATPGTDRARSRRSLLRHAVLQLVDRGVVLRGIPLASSANGTEVLADRRLRSQRGRNGERGHADLVQLQDGTQMTVTNLVLMVRAMSTPPPDALPGPSLLEMLVDMSRGEHREEWMRGSAEPVGTLLVELRRLQEEEEKEKEKAREMENAPDAAEVYGKGLPYVLNPYNENIVYVAANDEDADIDYLPHLGREGGRMSSLEWILTPPLKRKSGVSFENPG